VNGYNEFKDKIKIPQYDIIIDNPYEKEEDIIKTLMFLLKLPTPYQLSLYYLTFYPGTDLYKKAINDGIITNEQKEIYQKNYKKSKDENKDYLKNLLVLLSKYSSNGVSISPSIMNYLTNPKARRYYLHLPVYVSLKIKVILLKRIGHFNYILKEALKDIKTGNWFRIRAYVKKYFIRFN
jgi:hypothetical protein|tara:strand:- start:594 stop:1133 length:540 start_codon:yes stop_codon:yes gene_type:complete